MNQKKIGDPPGKVYIMHESGVRVPYLLVGPSTLWDGYVLQPYYMPSPEISEAEACELGITPWTSLAVIDGVRRDVGPGRKPRRGPAAPGRSPMRPAPTGKEAMRRLLNGRCTLAFECTGTDPDVLRHRAVAFATHDRTRSSMDRSVTAAEMTEAVAFVEEALVEAGYEPALDAADADYFARHGGTNRADGARA